MFRILLGDEAVQTGVSFGSAPAEEVLVHFQLRWKCSHLSVFSVGILGLIVFCT